MLNVQAIYAEPVCNYEFIAKIKTFPLAVPPLTPIKNGRCLSFSPSSRTSVFILFTRIIRPKHCFDSVFAVYSNSVVFAASDSVGFSRDVECDVITARQTRSPHFTGKADINCKQICLLNRRLINFLFFLKKLVVMLVLKRCVSFTSFLKTELPVSLALRCCYGGFPVSQCRSSRTASSHSSRCFLPAPRWDSRFSCCRRFSSPPPVREDSVGKIQSTHYQLVYTCKVSRPKPVPRCLEEPYQTTTLKLALNPSSSLHLVKSYF